MTVLCLVDTHLTGYRMDICEIWVVPLSTVLSDPSCIPTSPCSPTEHSPLNKDLVTLWGSNLTC